MFNFEQVPVFVLNRIKEILANPENAYMQRFLRKVDGHDEFGHVLVKDGKPQFELFTIKDADGHPVFLIIGIEGKQYSCGLKDWMILMDLCMNIPRQVLTRGKPKDRE